MINRTEYKTHKVVHLDVDGETVSIACLKDAYIFLDDAHPDDFSVKPFGFSERGYVTGLTKQQCKEILDQMDAGWSLNQIAANHDTAVARINQILRLTAYLEGSDCDLACDEAIEPDNGHEPENGHVCFLEKRLSGIRPSPENDKLYKPVDPNDPDIIELAESIENFGLKEPIVITEDNFILSGHRRYAACLVAGLETVQCRVEPVTRKDPQFLTMLRDFNLQRVKTFAEIAREEAISMDPEEPYRFLTEMREKDSQIEAETISIQGQKKRSKISKAKEPMLQAILQVIEDRERFWPLSDRQIHYALLNLDFLMHASKPDSRYRNDQKCYKSLCELATRARLIGRIPWNAIHDPTRPVVKWNVYQHPGQFIRKQFDRFLKGYYRNLLQSQPNHIEILGEKNTIESIIRPVAVNYCVPYTIGRGYASIPPRYEMMKRYEKSGKEKLILLVLSDFDPEGEDIAHSFARSMRDDFGVEERKLVPIKLALNKDQVEQFRLPPMMKAKEKSSRRKGFVEKHGDDVFELEALNPEDLQDIIREGIESVLDMKAFKHEVEEEKKDAAKLEVKRRALRSAFEDDIE